METKRFIEKKWLILFISILFGVILYLFLLKYFNKTPDIFSYKLKNFYLDYTIYSGVLFGILSFIFLLILSFILFIFRIFKFIFILLIYLLVFGLFLFLGIDLMFFEPNDADFAKVIIETFSIPLIFSSSIIILLVLILSFIKVEKK